MADYPTLCQDPQTRIIPANSLKIDYSESGIQRSVNANISTVYDAQIVHDVLTVEEKNSVITHYNSNKNNSFVFLYNVDSNYYRFVYVAKPDQSRNGSLWTVRSNFIGFKIGLSLNLVTYQGEYVTYNGEQVTYGGQSLNLVTYQGEDVTYNGEQVTYGG